MAIKTYAPLEGGSSSLLERGLDYVVLSCAAGAEVNVWTQLQRPAKKMMVLFTTDAQVLTFSLNQLVTTIRHRKTQNATQLMAVDVVEATISIPSKDSIILRAGTGVTREWFEFPPGIHSINCSDTPGDTNISIVFV